MPQLAIDRLRRRAAELMAEADGGLYDEASVAALLEDAIALQVELAVQRDELAVSHQRLQEMEEHYRSLFEVAPTAFLRISEQQHIEDANAAARVLLGLELRTGRSAPRSFASFVGTGSIGAWKRLLGLAGTTSRLTILATSGPIVADVRTVPWSGAGGGWLVVLDDVSALSEARAGRQRAEERFGHVVDRMSDGLVVVSALTGLIVSHNEGFAALVGREKQSLAGWEHESLFEPAHRGLQAAMLAQAHEQGRRGVRLRYAHPEGERVTDVTLGKVMEEGEVLEYLLVRDVTEKLRAEAERREVEARMTETQKLEALGLLAAGVAHDMNNVLAAVLGATELPPTPETLADLREAALRGRELTERLLAVSRRRPLREEQFDLLAVTAEVITLARHTFRREIQLVFGRPDEAWLLDGDAGQWHQALLNLAINARDAIAGAGTITIEVERTGKERALVVRDDGGGMTPEVARRALEPFFTTKGEGRGTGLGLAHVRAVVAAHGGRLSIDSAPGCGTAIRIAVAVAVARLAPSAVSRPAPTLPPAREGLRALIVDDEASIARVAARLLERAGWEATTVDSGRAALEQLERQSFDVVLTDRSMPEMNGEQLCVSVRERWPSVALVVMTGLADDSDIGALRELGARAVVHKPFRREELLAALRAAVADAAAG